MELDFAKKKKEKRKKKGKLNCLCPWIFFFQLWNLSCACQHNLISGLKFATSKRSFLQKIRFRLGQLSLLKALGFAFYPCPFFPPFTLVQFGHYGDWTFIFLGEGREPNQQAILISNNLKCFPFALSMYYISNFF
jgi:hypothetical protein